MYEYLGRKRHLLIRRKKEKGIFSFHLGICLCRCNRCCVRTMLCEKTTRVVESLIRSLSLGEEEGRLFYSHNHTSSIFPLSLVDRGLIHFCRSTFRTKEHDN